MGLSIKELKALEKQKFIDYKQGNSLPVVKKRQWPVGKQRRKPIIIDIPQRKVKRVHVNKLSAYLEYGRHIHPLCRDSFIERIEVGYYHYERRIEWHTCALAAACVGAFGAKFVERTDFSYTMALWMLNRKLGYVLQDCMVVGPTGRYQSIVDEMIQLIDADLWTRAGVADWLFSVKR